MDSPELSTESTEVQPDQGQGQHVDTPSAVQPDSGQGQQGESSLYAEALSAIPEEHRQYVEPHFKEWDRRVNPKLAEAAALRDQWAPYGQIGIDKYDPESLGALIELGNALGDPEAAQEVIRDLAAHFGVDLTAGEEPGEVDPIDEVRSQLAAVAEWQQQRDAAEVRSREERAALDRLTQEWAEVQQGHGQEFSEAESEQLLGLAEALAATSETPVKDAYDLIRSIAGSATTQFVASAPSQPRAAEPAGRASTVAEPPQTIEEAERLHREMRRAAS